MTGCFAGPANARGRAFAVAVIVAVSGAGPSAVSAQVRDDPAWTLEKCALYQHAVNDAINLLGQDGLRVGFLEENANFIAAGCHRTDAICAVTDQEIALANLLTVMTMNEGMASTFVPFSCKPAT